MPTFVASEVASRSRRRGSLSLAAIQRPATKSTEVAPISTGR